MFSLGDIKRKKVHRIGNIERQLIGSKIINLENPGYKVFKPSDLVFLVVVPGKTLLTFSLERFPFTDYLLLLVSLKN